MTTWEQDVQEIYKEFLDGLQGSAHPVYFEKLLELAVRRKNCGSEEPDSALACHRSLISDYRELLGELHPSTLSLETDIAALLAYSGDFEESLLHHRRLIPLVAASLGHESLASLALRLSYSEVLRELDRTNDYLAELQAVDSLADLHLPNGEADAFRARTALLILDDQRLAQTTDAELSSFISAALEVLGHDDADLVQLRLVAAGRCGPLSVADGRALLADATRIFGEGSGIAATAGLTLAHSLIVADRLDEAADLLEGVDSTARQTFTEDDSAIRDIETMRAQLEVLRHLQRPHTPEAQPVEAEHPCQDEEDRPTYLLSVTVEDVLGDVIESMVDDMMQDMFGERDD